MLGLFSALNSAKFKIDLMLRISFWGLDTVGLLISGLRLQFCTDTPVILRVDSFLCDHETSIYRGLIVVTQGCSRCCWRHERWFCLYKSKYNICAVETESSLYHSWALCLWVMHAIWTDWSTSLLYEALASSFSCNTVIYYNSLIGKQIFDWFSKTIIVFKSASSSFFSFPCFPWGS